MTFQQSRLIARKMHIVIALLQMVYIYTPIAHFEEVRHMVQWVTFPLLMLSGLWLGFGGKICKKYGLLHNQETRCSH